MKLPQSLKFIFQAKNCILIKKLSVIADSDCLVFDTSTATLFSKNGNLGISVTIWLYEEKERIKIKQETG